MGEGQDEGENSNWAPVRLLSPGYCLSLLTGYLEFDRIVFVLRTMSFEYYLIVPPNLLIPLPRWGEESGERDLSPGVNRNPNTGEEWSWYNFIASPFFPP
jgi:hypothetical protein